MITLRIRGLDPLVFTDGRPFSADPGSQVAGGLTVPTQRQLAGSIRTAIGLGDSRSWEQKGPELLSVAVHGPILERDGEMLFSAPSDMAAMEDSEGVLHLVRARPSDAPIRSNLPLGMRAIRLALPDGLELRPSKKPGPRLMTLRELSSWFLGSDTPSWANDAGGVWRISEASAATSWAKREPKTERRTHVGLQFNTLSAEEGQLFQTNGAVLSRTLCSGEYALIARSDKTVEGIFPFGAERRMAQIQSASEAALECPEAVRKALKGVNQVALVLATPGCFSAGWHPDSDKLKARFGLGFLLKSAAVRRRVCASGWDIARGGPRPVAWLAPEGATYFFEIDGDAQLLADAWFTPVNDNPADDLNGHGLGLWFPVR